MATRKALVLDPAHGRDTAGKRSPDGAHKEYLWSRERLIKVYKKLLELNNLPFDLHSPFLYSINEPGLTNRVLAYNDIAESYDKTFVLSLHNDAFGNDWHKARGTSVWTSRGEDDSDPIATSLFLALENNFPNVKFRSAYWKTKGEKTADPDWEKDFTILAGNSYVKPKYNAVLLEWLFQTNKYDVAMLQDEFYNKKLENTISNWLLNEFS